MNWFRWLLCWWHRRHVPFTFFDADGTIPRERVLCAYDDRDKVVAAWRAAGVPCFQVAPGDF